MVNTGLSKPTTEDDGMRAVTLPSGAAGLVHEDEVTYFRERSKRYMKDNSFHNISDLQDIDRLLVAELLWFRYGFWLATQRNYWGEQVDEKELHRAIKDLSVEIRALKKSLSLDKETRDKQRGEDSPAAYIVELRRRAREFGYMRERQLDRALELFNELKSKVSLYDNCNEDERVEMGIQTPDKILDWIREEVIPKYDEVDQHFRDNEQKYWIRKQ